MLRNLLVGGISSVCLLGYVGFSTAAEPPGKKAEAGHDLRPILEKLRKNEKLVEGKTNSHAASN